MTARKSPPFTIRGLRDPGAWVLMFALVVVGAGGFAHDLFVHHDRVDGHCPVCLLTRHATPLIGHVVTGPALAEVGHVACLDSRPAPAVLREAQSPRGPPSLPA